VEMPKPSALHSPLFVGPFFSDRLFVRPPLLASTCSSLSAGSRCVHRFSSPLPRGKNAPRELNGRHLVHLTGAIMCVCISSSRSSCALPINSGPIYANNPHSEGEERGRRTHLKTLGDRKEMAEEGRAIYQLIQLIRDHSSSSHSRKARIWSISQSPPLSSLFLAREASQ